MRKLSVILTLLVCMAAVLPASAQEGNPLAESVLLPNVVAWALVGLALLLMLLFVLWTRRGPQ